MILAFFATYARQLKLALWAASYAAAFYAGHYITHNAYEAEKAAHTQVIADSIPEVITKTQIITKVIHDSQDKCAAAAMPDAVLNELR